MKTTSTLIVLILGVITTTYSANIPKSLITCKKADADYKNCLNKAGAAGLKTFAAGDKSLNIPPLDPMDIKQVHITGNGGSVDLEQTYIDMTMQGFSDTTFNDIKIDIEGDQCSIKMETLSPRVVLAGNYKFTGKLLVFTLNGHGPHSITCLDMKVFHDIKCEKYEKKGKMHIKVNEFKLDLQPAKLVYDFKNLIDGNDELSTEVLKVMNENNLEIFKELKADYEKTFGVLFKNFCNQLFAKLPNELLFS